ncbi:HesB/YadR/YfhF family protein [Bacillus sp. V5-8f]|uniref:HesB/YadR/YfhF family protein n=1 Tax=Bacillus sp. V5-8f TaxID=2053044 RepID=UPI000C78D466|nr:HesB/YadR/YfhF family protein [Bacillus sp. V5-8f]PLT32502.1 hypothetical protein CUU64_18515 [Bacillus sp. V5-8f]
MNLTISDEAAAWYINEMNLKNGDTVRFFARYGGCSTVQSGFSLGVSTDKPINAATQTEKNGIMFFIEENDAWYFDENNLSVTLNEKFNEPEYHYKK